MNDCCPELSSAFKQRRLPLRHAPVQALSLGCTRNKLLKVPTVSFTAIRSFFLPKIPLGRLDRNVIET
jgi:hypothetical protein